jgi:hypothetical protein
VTTIYYDLENFANPLPNGLVSPKVGTHPVRPARLVWAAATIGYSPYGQRHNRRTSALELQWRQAMIRASVQPQSDYFYRTMSYSRLDLSEKGAVSFFLGQAQAKLFAHDFFRVSRFMHYDKYLEHIGQRRSNTRPDFVGFRGRQTAIAVEAKGRSHGWTARLINRAKNQVEALPLIKGYPDPIRYVHVAFFDGDEWCARLVDPPEQRIDAPPVDPGRLTLSYYQQIVSAIRDRPVEPERVRLDDGITYLSTYFQDVDSRLSVRADIADLVPTADDGRDESGQANSESVGQELYEQAIELDADRTDKLGIIELEAEWGDNESFFLGGDGVAVELGASWAEWNRELG